MICRTIRRRPSAVSIRWTVQIVLNIDSQPQLIESEKKSLYTVIYAFAFATRNDLLTRYQIPTNSLNRHQLAGFTRGGGRVKDWKTTKNHKSDYLVSGVDFWIEFSITRTDVSTVWAWSVESSGRPYLNASKLGESNAQFAAVAT